MPSEANGQTASELVRPVDFFLHKEQSIAAAIEKRNAESRTTTLPTHSPATVDSEDRTPWNVSSSDNSAFTTDAVVASPEESLF